MSAAVTTLALDDGNLVAVTVQDCEEVVERNKVGQADPHRSDWGRPIAEIPNVIVVKWLNEEWRRGNTQLRPYTKEWKAFVKRKLADPDWAYLRCTSQQGAPTGWRASEWKPSEWRPT